MAVEAPPKPPLNNVANQLTMSRLGLGVVLFVLIGFHLWLWCLLIFALATVTDWLDGYYARKYNLVSALGRMLDPLVDKIVVCGAFILLIDPHHAYVGFADTGLAGWMVVLIVAREFLVTGIRSYMEQEGIPFGADMWGKIKMVLQSAVLLMVFLLFALEAMHAGRPGTDEDYMWLVLSFATLKLIRDILLWSMLVVTAGSGLNYCWKAARMTRA